MESWGASPDIIEKTLGIEEDEGPDLFEVYPENWEAVIFFLHLQTQWIVAGFGERTGLSYPGVEVAARLREVDLTKELFCQIQVMEIAAVKEMKSHGASE